MALEYEIRNGALNWIRNPYSCVVSYVVDVRGKSFAFTLGERRVRQAGEALDPGAAAQAIANCPFCPGQEASTPAELMRVEPSELPEWNGGAEHRFPWLIRAINNLYPRIPTELTGGRNESYIVIEDPRHFIDSSGVLLWPGALSEEHFFSLMVADVRVMRLALSNPAVVSIVIRKNQGPESGASQPHVHHQVIGSPTALPVLEAEERVAGAHPGFWTELIALTEHLGLFLERDGEVLSFQSPIGAFPRSYDVVMPEYAGLLSELDPHRLRRFTRLLHRILRVMGPAPLDYEIHQGMSIPLHAHINARLFPYANVAGTLNLPATLLESAATMRRALEEL
jgi:hypothetical protein